MGPDARPEDLVEALGTVARILSAVVSAAPPDARAVIWRRPRVEVRGPDDFAPRARSSWSSTPTTCPPASAWSSRRPPTPAPASATTPATGPTGAAPAGARPRRPTTPGTTCSSARAAPDGTRRTPQGAGGTLRRSHRSPSTSRSAAPTRRPARRTRWSAAIHAALGDAATIVNVGAGHRQLRAAPTARWWRSSRRRRCWPSGRAARSRWCAAVAEALPFADAAFDAGLALLTVHHWGDPAAGLRELRPGERAGRSCSSSSRCTPTGSGRSATSPRRSTCRPSGMPRARSCCAPRWRSARCGPCWSRPTAATASAPRSTGGPRRTSTPSCRRACRGWRSCPPTPASAAPSACARDLASGAWDRRHGHLRTQPTYDGGYRLAVAGA